MPSKKFWVLFFAFFAENEEIIAVQQKKRARCTTKVAKQAQCTWENIPKRKGIRHMVSLRSDEINMLSADILQFSYRTDLAHILLSLHLYGRQHQLLILRIHRLQWFRDHF